MNAVCAALKRSTEDCHRRLERRLPLFDPQFARADYLRLLQCFLGYYRPLESLLSGVPELPRHPPDCASKSSWLETDLLALGMTPSEIQGLPICRELPEATNPYSGFGCLYVLEGATLGGQAISRHLRRTLDIDAACGARFFSSYGRETPARWQAFGARLAAAVQGERPQTEAIRAARETFLRLEAWLERCGLLKPVSA